MSTAAVIALLGGAVLLVVVVGRIHRVNQQALAAPDRRRRRGQQPARQRRSSLAPDHRPGLEDQPRGIRSGVYVLEIRHRRADRGDVDYLKIGSSGDVPARISTHRTLEGNNLGVYGILWTTDHASLEEQVHRDLRPWRIEAPGVTAVELYEPDPEVYKRLDWLWR